ncbi:MAG: DUF4382 domain-containing protein [Terracidiphilus sp.]|jgi:hypothetical protein
MDTRTHGKYLLIAFVSLAATLLAVGCNSGATLTDSQSTVTGPAFVVGTDAPMASVVSFTTQVQNVCAVTTASNTGVSECVPLLSGTPTVDFARYNGLQSLLDINSIRVGTYTQIEITVGAATIGYLNVPASGAPTIATEAATYSSSASTYTYTATLAAPLVVTQAGAPVGLRVDYDLRKSIGVDTNGNITGAVTPTFDVSTVGTGDAGGYIDTLVASVVSVGTTSFVVQGPHGEQFTIDVTGTTEWENSANGDGLSSLVAGSSIVEVSGILDRADQTLDADDVAILSQSGFYAGGQVTYVTPASGAATSFDLYVRGLLPTSTGLTLGEIATVDLSNDPKFFIYWMHNPVTELLFSSSSMMPGQHVSVGGPASGATNASAVTVNRVVLRQWGFNGTVTAASVSPAATGVTAFQMQINGFAGVLVPQTVTVYCVPDLKWRNGLTAMSDLKVGANVRVVGLLLNLSGKPVLVGHYVDALE